MKKYPIFLTAALSILFISSCSSSAISETPTNCIQSENLFKTLDEYFISVNHSEIIKNLTALKMELLNSDSAKIDKKQLSEMLVQVLKTWNKILVFDPSLLRDQSYNLAAWPIRENLIFNTLEKGDFSFEAIHLATPATAKGFYTMEYLLNYIDSSPSLNYLKALNQYQLDLIEESIANYNEKIKNDFKDNRGDPSLRLKELFTQLYLSSVYLRKNYLPYFSAKVTADTNLHPLAPGALIQTSDTLFLSQIHQIFALLTQKENEESLSILACAERLSPQITQKKILKQSILDAFEASQSPLNDALSKRHSLTLVENSLIELEVLLRADLPSLFGTAINFTDNDGD